jgi:hypothetical protein
VRSGRSLVHFNEVLGNGQTETQATRFSRRRRVFLPEPLEHVRQEGSGNATSIVLNRNADLTAKSLDARFHPATRGLKSRVALNEGEGRWRSRSGFRTRKSVEPPEDDVHGRA